MHRFLVLIISLFALTACPPPPPPDAGASSTAASGAGGDAGPADVATASAEASTSTGAPTDGCVGPSPRHTTCDSAGDCFDSSSCTEDLCDLGTPPDPPDPFGRKGTCLWKLAPNGTACDVSDGHDTCQDGACCPPADGGVAATVPQLPEAR